MPMAPAMRLRSTMTPGLIRPAWSWTSKSVPPANTLAEPLAAARARTASSTVDGDW
jgi:hypothetical protein